VSAVDPKSDSRRALWKLHGGDRRFFWCRKPIFNICRDPPIAIQCRYCSGIGMAVTICSGTIPTWFGSPAVLQKRAQICVPTSTNRGRHLDDKPPTPFGISKFNLPCSSVCPDMHGWKKFVVIPPRTWSEMCGFIGTCPFKSAIRQGIAAPFSK